MVLRNLLADAGGSRIQKKKAAPRKVWSPAAADTVSDRQGGYSGVITLPKPTATAPVLQHPSDADNLSPRTGGGTLLPAPSLTVPGAGITSPGPITGTPLVDPITADPALVDPGIVLGDPGAAQPGAGLTTPGSALTADMLDAALRAIEAEFGLTSAQLLADESDVGRRYRMMFAELQRIGVQQREQLEGRALDRGILRSGIFADDSAKLEGVLAEQAAATEADQAAQMAGIASQRAALPAQQAAAEAAAAQQAASAGLSLDLVRAAAAGGI